MTIFFRREATVEADSAVYFKNKQLWRLDGNVNITNVMNEKFLTNQLYWDQRQHKLYSDSFIHIERPDKVLEGYGFDSNEQLTRYTIRKVSGIFPAGAFRPGGRGAGATSDSEDSEPKDSDDDNPVQDNDSITKHTTNDTYSVDYPFRSISLFFGSFFRGARLPISRLTVSGSDLIRTEVA